MTVNLARDVEEFLEAELRAGKSSDASDLVNDVLRSVRDQQQRAFDITPELEAWLLEAADKPVTELRRSDFDAVRSRVRQRTKTSTP